MKKLRHSRFAKFVSSMVIILTAILIAVNAVGTVILMDENLYYASREHLQQKLYTYLHNYTANDLMKYLNVAREMYTNNENNKNYYRSEAELFASKYSSEKSNLCFSITDEQGNILLKNSNASSDKEYFSFSSLFTSDTETYNDDWYFHDDTVILPEETTIHIADTEKESTVENTNDVTSDDAQSEISAVSDNTALATEENNYSLEEVQLNNIYSDQTISLLYYYNGIIDEQIYAHCRDLALHLQYNISSVTFYQNDFMIDENDNVTEMHTANEISLPEKSFSTVLSCKEKTAIIEYRYNGSFYINEFQDRLALTSLILQNCDTDTVEISYKQKGRIQLNVNVLVPYNNEVTDIYKIAEAFTDFAVFYRDNIVFFSVVDIVLFVLSLIFLFYSAGYIPGNEKPSAKGLHRIPFDVTLLFDLFIIGCTGIFILYTSDFLALFWLVLIAVTALYTIYTAVVRIRTLTLKENNLSVKFYRAFKNALTFINRNASVKIRVLLSVGLFILVSLFEVLTLIVLSTSSEMISLFLLIIRIAELPLVVLILAALLILQNGAKKISEGDVNFRINSPILKGQLKQHAEYLNSINDAVNSAVEQRVKSESLKSELITNVSHDLKTPLTSIVNYVDLLKKENINNNKALEYIEVIDRQSQRLKKLTADIVEASKASTGNIEVNKEKLALSVFLLQTNGEYIERLEEKSLSLIRDIPDEEVYISADGRLLWRVIDNLMNNICKYSMAGTRVYLKLNIRDDKAHISFSNISRNALNTDPENLTERFVRGDASRNTEGSGLGLSIANSLTEIMGGKLDINIDGDLFKVTLIFPCMHSDQ